MDEAGLPFRATKDFDVVLFVEVLDARFAEAFWTFVEVGGYERRAKADGGKLYRFERPTANDVPRIIELFSRAPNGFELAPGSALTPLPIAEEADSLSAILLDEAYYAFLRANTREVDGLPLLGEAGLVPFKAKAFLDLSARREAGEPVDSKDIRKHRNDVFRILQLLPADIVHALPEGILSDMRAFHGSVAADGTFKPEDFEVMLSPADALARLAAAYGL
ncbi:MAG: hypothetical protein ACREEB_12455 [Caulobacteraceae bacterium]